MLGNPFWNIAYAGKIESSMLLMVPPPPTKSINLLVGHISLAEPNYPRRRSNGHRATKQWQRQRRMRINAFSVLHSFLCFSVFNDLDSTRNMRSEMERRQDDDDDDQRKECANKKTNIMMRRREKWEARDKKRSSLHAWEGRSRVTYSIRPFSYRTQWAAATATYDVHIRQTAHQCTL